MYICNVIGGFKITDVYSALACTFVHVPLCWGSVHDDVDPEYLHSIERARQTHHCGESDESQSCYTPTQPDMNMTLHEISEQCM